ncbi:hypothetical protein G5I_00841 [Acromyrmex echinatior]|uniref:Uncharacterized protein n=1 Tax=Acromyrmex echinatior TaxID=103372 RepID=F4W5Z1_ACREC|nr:hypothetical protein G5I_00841 [Acromyrmex echinatior]
MPVENHDQLSSGGERRGGSSGSAPMEHRELSRGGRGEPDLRNRGTMTTMIPLPRTGQFTSATQNQKIAKTEKNRQRLIMKNHGTVTTIVDLVKKGRIGRQEEEALQNNWRMSTANCSAIARYAEEFGDSHQDEKGDIILHHWLADTCKQTPVRHTPSQLVPGCHHMLQQYCRDFAAILLQILCCMGCIQDVPQNDRQIFRVLHMKYLVIILRHSVISDAPEPERYVGRPLERQCCVAETVRILKRNMGREHPPKELYANW